jgi:hypothetical protein
METLRDISNTRPLLYGWTCYLGAWLAMGLVVQPVGQLIYPAIGAGNAMVVYYVCSGYLGYRLLRLRRRIADQLGDPEANDNYFGPLLRLIGWVLFWQVTMAFSLAMRGLRVARY